jgi:hypothetical protein
VNTTSISEQSEISYHQSSVHPASITASATLNERLHRAKWPKHPNNKGFDKSGAYLKSSEVAGAVIEAF